MSGRRRRSETLWDSKEEAIPPAEISGKIPSRGKELHSSFNGNNSPKWSNLEANDALMSDDFSGQPSLESMQGNENLPTDNDISRDRRRMQSDPAFDEWENQYSSRPSDDSYSMPYRARDRGVSRTGSISSSRARDRSRSSSRSPKRNRSIDRHRSGSRRMAESRSRSRDSPPQNKGSYGNKKDSSDITFRDIREPCKFFAEGKCTRKNCKYSHDIMQSGGNDVISHDNIQGHSLGNKNLTWNDPQLRDDLNASGFSDLADSNRSFDGKNKLWSGPSWDDFESGKFNEISHDEKNRVNTLDDKNKPWDGPSWGNVAIAMDESKDANQQILSFRQDFIHNSNLNGNEQQSGHMVSLSPLNGLNDSIHLQGMFLDLDSVKQSGIQNKENSKPLETSKMSSILANNEQIPQVSLPQMPQNITNAIEFLNSLANSASCGPPIDSIVTQQNLDNKSNEKNESARDLEKKNSKKNKKETVSNSEGNEGENTKHEQENVGHGGNDEKAIRLFKAALVEFVKEILKPTWKEGKMSREVYKTVVKKVVDKVTSTIQGTQIPRTQERIDQYLAFSKSKITKLVEAYVERFLKA